MYCSLFIIFYFFSINLLWLQQNVRNEVNSCNVAPGCLAITSLSLAKNELYLGTIRVTLSNTKLYLIRVSVNWMLLVIG